MKHRNVEQFPQALFDLETPWRGDVLEIDAAVHRRERADGLDDLLGVLVSRQTGHASTPANRLNSAALPSITGSAAAGPMLPSPSTADPSVTTATVLRLIVSRRASSGFSAIARQIRATPGVYARERSSRWRSDTFGTTSILPPKCIKNVRSLTLRTWKLGSASTLW